jgi:polyisoprenyl-teichoic acid--peptidoglycan teichoic acid transferase
MTDRILNARLSRRNAVAAGAVLTAAGALKVTPAMAGRQDTGGVYTFIAAGIDTRTKEEPENTDVLMVSRVDLDAGTVRSMSFPRDLLVEIPGVGFDKINRAYDYGSKAADGDWDAGVALMTQTMELNFGLTFDGVATTNFKGFEAVVDALGGIEVDNPYDLADSEYPTEDYGVKEIFYPAGVQTLNGEQALEFSRTRHQDGDDGRVMRQQLVLAALLKKAQDPATVKKLPELVKAAKDAVTTNIPADLQMKLIAAVPSISPEDVVFGTMTQYLWGDTTSSGMWVYQGDWNTLPGYVESWLAGA